MFHASGSKELHPVVPHVFVYQEYVRNVPTTLCIKEKAWSLSGVSLSAEGASERGYEWCAVGCDRQGEFVDGLRPCTDDLSGRWAADLGRLAQCS